MRPVPMNPTFMVRILLVSIPQISPVFPARGAAPLARLRASATRYGGAPQMRGPGYFAANRGPGSAAHHFAALVLRCARDTSCGSLQLPAHPFELAADIVDDVAGLQMIGQHVPGVGLDLKLPRQRHSLV